MTSSGRLDLGGDLGSYSWKQIMKAIEQRSYDLRRRYNTMYSQNVSQTLIVS